MAYDIVMVIWWWWWDEDMMKLYYVHNCFKNIYKLCELWLYEYYVMKYDDAMNGMMHVTNNQVITCE